MDNNQEIIDRVSTIVELESEHANLGVSFATLDKSKNIGTSREVLAHVIGVLEAVKELDIDPSQIIDVDEVRGVTDE